MEKNALDLIEKLDQEILPPLISQLKAKSESLRDKPINEFTSLIESLTEKATNKLLQYAELEDATKLSKDLKNILVIVLISRFNSALALDYPYVVAALHVGPAPEKPGLEKLNHLAAYSFIRKEIPGMDKRSNAATAPICFVDKPEDIQEKKIMASRFWFLTRKPSPNSGG